MQRAYSTLVVKAVDEEARIIEGIASTPSTDRMGDVVEPRGAKFSLPLPLLWQHQHGAPIGHVISAQVTDDGIRVRAQIAKGVLPSIDEAWALIKSGLVRGLSIGFQPLKQEPIKGSGGYRFTSWSWHELSAVTIPANADASISLIRSLDDEALAASGRTAPVSTSIPPGVTGRSTRNVMNPSEQIVEKQSLLKLKNQRMQELASIEEDGNDLTAEQSSEYDKLTADSAVLAKSIERLEAIERNGSVLSAKGVSGTSSASGSASRGGSVITVKSNLPPGIEFARYAICKMAAYVSQGSTTAVEVARQRYPDNPRIVSMLKTAVTPSVTTDSNSHGALVDPTNLASEFIEYLRPQTIVGRLNLRRVPFNVRVVGQTTGASAAWVGQNAQKPVTKFNTSPTTLGFAKIATISVLSDELARFSSPSAEALVRDELARAIVERMDVDFIDPDKAAESGVSPASVTNGVTPGTSAGNDAADVRTDLKALLATYLEANNSPTTAALIMPNTLALSVSLMVNALGQPEFPGLTMNGGTLLGIPVITSQYADLASPTNNLVIMVNQSDVFLSDDGGVSVDVSREASIEMSDTPGSDSGTVVSMWQNNLIAIRAERYVNWAKRRSTAVAFLDAVTWGDEA